MRIGRYEFGLTWHLGWYGFKKDEKCLAGCRIYMFGPFFFTILAGECVAAEDGETEECIVGAEKLPDFTSIVRTAQKNVKKDRKRLLLYKKTLNKYRKKKRTKKKKRNK